MDKRIFTYNQFLNESTYSPLETYKVLVYNLTRAFNILAYLENIAKPGGDNREWDLLTSKVVKEKDPVEKFDILIEYASKKHRDLTQYAKERAKDFEGKFGFVIFDVALLSERIPDVIKNLKQASALLTKDLSSEKIETRANLIDQSLPKERNFVFESLNYWIISESVQTKNPPYDSDIITLIDRISANIVAFRGIARSIVTVYPQSKDYTENVVSQYLDPQEKKLNELIDLKGVYSDKALPKSVIQAYEQRGWRIKNAAEKSAVDLYLELEKVSAAVVKAGEMIRQASSKIGDSLSSNDAASQWISAAKEMLDKIEDQIRKKEEMEDKNRRRRSMLPTPDEETPQNNQSTEEGGSRSISDEMNRLRIILGSRQ